MYRPTVGLPIRLREFAFWPSWRAPEYGLLLVETDAGERWTLRGDPGLVEMVRDARASALSDATLPDATLGGQWQARRGWPDDWIPQAFDSDDWEPLP